MVQPLLSLAAIGLLVLACTAYVARERVLQKSGLVILFLGVYFLDNLIIVTTNQHSQLQLLPQGIWQGWLIWGWSGKIYSVLACLVVVFLFRSFLSLRDVGLTPRQSPGSFKPALVVLIAMAIWSAFIGTSYPQGPFDLSVLVYMAILPGLNEELVYRGLLLGTLNQVMGRNWHVFGAYMGWGAVITSLLFGLLHGFWFDGNLKPHVDVMAVVLPGVWGLVNAWLRERTGSLVIPIATHGVEDFTIFLFRMI